MIRLFKSNKFIEKMINTFKTTSGILKLVRFSISVVLLVHIVACFWFFMAKLVDFDPDTWVSRYGLID